jgi:hypothetical protein
MTEAFLLFFLFVLFLLFFDFFCFSFDVHDFVNYDEKNVDNIMRNDSTVIIPGAIKLFYRVCCLG